MEDIDNVIDIHNILEASGKQYEHNIWVYKKSLSSRSLDYLEKKGIYIREIEEINKKLKIPYIFYVTLVDKEFNLGITSSILRAEILNIEGGIYMDLNYNLNRDLEPEIYRYSFLSRDGVSLIMSKAHHPILEEWLVGIEKNFYYLPDFVKKTTENLWNTKATTKALTSLPLAFAYFKKANQNENIDVLYPEQRKEISFSAYDQKCYLEESVKNKSNENKKTEFCINDYFFQKIHIIIEENQEFIRDSQELEMCLADSFIIGKDGANGKTWDIRGTGSRNSIICDSNFSIIEKEIRGDLHKSDEDMIHG